MKSIESMQIIFGKRLTRKEMKKVKGGKDNSKAAFFCGHPCMSNADCFYPCEECRFDGGSVGICVNPRE